MSRFYLRRDLGPRENLGALAAALGVGVVTFYCLRLVLGCVGFDRKAPKRLPATGADTGSAPASDR